MLQFAKSCHTLLVFSHALDKHSQASLNINLGSNLKTTAPSHAPAIFAAYEDCAIVATYLVPQAHMTIRPKLLIMPAASSGAFATLEGTELAGSRVTPARRVLPG